MPYRVVPPHSDRGSIKDIQKNNTERLEENPNDPPTQAELRIKSLYEQAVVLRDQALIDSLGLIVMDGSAKDPVSVLRHRLYVQELKNKLGSQITDAEKDINLLIQDEPGPMEMRVAAYRQEGARNTILSEEGDILIKNASDANAKAVGSFRRSFWRAKE
jgi:hypothetical protein